MLTKLFSIFKKSNKPPPMQLDHHYLYHFSACPYCIRVQMTISKLGLNIESRDIHQEPEHYKRLTTEGGRGMVPCLLIEKEGRSEWMYESADIIAYLKEKLG